MKIDVVSTGFEELFKKMDDLSEEVGKGKTDRIWRNAVKYAFEPVLQDAKTYAPKDTGQLSENIYMAVHKPKSRDKKSMTYQGEMYMARVTASPVRDDSIKKTVLNRRGKFQSYYANKRPVALSKEFGNARTTAKPFLRPALQSNMDRVQTRLAQSVWEAIQNLVKKG